MQKMLKSTFFIVIMLFTVSLIGCGMNTSAPQESKKVEITSTETAKQTDKATEKAKSSQTEEKKTTEANVNKQEDSSKKDNKQAQSKKTVEIKKNPSTNEKEQPKTTKENSKPRTSAAVVKKSTSSSLTKKTNTTTTKTTEKTKTVSPKPAVQKPIQTVTISIVGPKDRGTIMTASKISIKEGDTVLKVLLSATQKKGVAVDYKGSGATAYVEGIDNLYEFDYGPKSGWTCKKNGVTIPKSAGVITVKAGDRIDWIYTEDYSEKK